MSKILSRNFFEERVSSCAQEEVCIIPKIVTHIDHQAFYDWKSLKYVVIPPNIEEIAYDAFLWDDIKIIFTDLEIPSFYKGKKFPYTEQYEIIINLYQQLELTNSKINISSNDIENKREEVNQKIRNSMKYLEQQETKLNQNMQKLQELYERLLDYTNEEKGLSDQILNTIDKEVKERIEKTLKEIEQLKETLKNEQSLLIQKLKTTQEFLEQTLNDIEEKAQKVQNNFEEEVNSKIQNSKKNIKTQIDDLNKQIGNISHQVAKKAIEEVREASPYKNITIVLNDEVQKVLKKKLIHRQLESVIKILSLKLHPLLVGPAGCGKNVILEQSAEALGLTFRYVNDVTEEYKVMGFVDANGVYKETQFFKAFTEGGLMMIDEMDNSSPSALLAINAAIGTGYNQYLAFPDGKLYPANENFYLAGAANTYGTGADMIYCGRNALDGASLNRFVPIYIDYDKDLEENLVSDTSILPLYWEVRNAINKNKIHHVISTRNIVEANKMKRASMFSNEEIFDYTIIQSLTDDDLRVIAKHLYSVPLDYYQKEFLRHLELNRNISINDYYRR